MLTPSPGLNLPPIAGDEALLLVEAQLDRPVFLPQTTLKLGQITSGFACALHMHQPTIPAGAQGELISHLQYMLDHPQEADNHNAEPFLQCYKRMGTLIPELIKEGCHPRIMLDYSGTLLWGLQQMGREDVLQNLKFLTSDPVCQPAVEWLGTLWSHAVVPSTPIPDLKLQMLGWRQHFAALFGHSALRRVKGFSPPEMHLPNHPDTLYAFVRALKDCGYSWLLVQEHSVENLDGTPLHREQTFLPNRLVAQNSSGETVTIVALIKTQGSDTKLIGQMQPYAEALGLKTQSIAGRLVPPLVSQIADGENGGVMMNEFPRAYREAHHRMAAAWDESPRTVAMNGTEYLELLEAEGLQPTDYPSIQAIHQHKLWQHLGSQRNPAATEAAIAELQASEPHFSMDGASWTNDHNWVAGYENVLEPMHRLSARFHATFDPMVAADPTVTQTSCYQEALLYLLLLETSCFRYWGQGRWTDYAHELHRRGEAACALAGSPR